MVIHFDGIRSVCNNCNKCITIADLRIGIFGISLCADCLKELGEMAQARAKQMKGGVLPEITLPKGSAEHVDSVIERAEKKLGLGKTHPTSVEFDYNGYHLEACRGRFRAFKDGKLVSSAIDCFPRGTPTKEEVIKFWNFVHTEE